MSSLDEQLKNFIKSDKYKKQLEDLNKKGLLKSNRNISGGSLVGATNIQGGSKELAEKCLEDFKEILKDEISKVKMEYADPIETLNHILTDIKFEDRIGWTIEINFDSEYLHRDSLYEKDYPNGAELDEIFNNGTNADGVVYGNWHGSRYKSKPHREASHFVQHSVNKLKEKYPNYQITYNEKYDDIKR